MRKILLLLLMLLPMMASAHDFEVKGGCYVDGICYIINGNEATVTYASVNYNYQYYKGDITIPSDFVYDGVSYSVTSIGERAFYNCSGITSITIPNSVRSIGPYAFSGCTGLITITIPDSVTDIGHYSFSYCTNLTSISNASSVTSIGQFAFSNCTSLSSINLPNVVSIELRAFQGCTSLSDLNIGFSASHIAYDALTETAWYENQPDGLVYAGSVAYKYKGTMPSQTSIVLKNETLGIAGSAFDGCDKLKSITIPNSLVYIGSYAFRGCSSLRSIDVPNTLTSIEECTFTGCTLLSSFTIPKNVTHIGNAAFSNCYSLSDITIPKNVKDMGYRSFYTQSSNFKVTILGDIDTVTSTMPFSNVYTLVIAKNVSRLPNLNISPSIVYCYSETPPLCNDQTFSSYYALHVPAASLASYFTAPIWENFIGLKGDAVEPQSISLSHTEVEIPLGDQMAISSTVLPANSYYNGITWISSDISIATVKNGIISAVGVGECDITASCIDKETICHVIVKNSTITISIDENEISILPNHISILSVSASSGTMPNLSVTSSDPSVAAARVVNNKIQVVGIKEGTTTITVGSVDGTAIPATCLVTVYTEPGDMNSDGFVTISDVTSLIDYLLGGDETSITTKNADVNGDGNISISDVTNLIDILLSENG